MRGTPWLGSRRGVVITSRSDRVPLLSRRHTLAEKQNGTSDRPSDPSPFSPSSFPLLRTLRGPVSVSRSLRSHLAFSRRVSRNFDLDEIFSRNCRHVAGQREKRGRSNYKSHRHPKSHGERKRKERREELRGESRVPTFSNRLEALEIRFGRLMIGGSGRSSAERPRATRRNPVSRPSDSRNGGHGKEIPSRRESGPQKRLGVLLIYERDPASISLPREY